MGADAVFISYSHDSPEHQERVLALSDKLRAMGVDVELDQYHTRPSQGWPQWCEEKLRPTNSKFVLLICTETYRNRVDNEVPADEGRGVYWEGSVINNYLYREKANERFIPVLFGDESDESIPIRLQGFAKFRVKAFDLSDPGFEALYRELTGQPAVLKPALGERVALGTKAPAAMQVAGPLPEKQAVTTFEPPAPPPVDISAIVGSAPKESVGLVGREAETRAMDDAWAKAVSGEPHPRVMTFVALGGEGKSALVAKWAGARSAKDWPDCEAAYAWSFFSQGTREQQAASADLFLAEALKFFGAPAVEGVESAHDKGKRLAKWIGEKRAILILDGIEPLQYPPGPPLDGQLKDEGVRSLLKGLAQRNKGLCLVTTRCAIKDLEGDGATAPQNDLAPLSKEEGARLLQKLQVNGTQKEREQLSEDIRGHALTLNLIGGYLHDAYGGDIRKRDLIRLEEATEEQGSRAFRVMDEYVRWFESDGENGQRALAMLRLLGLFDRPADAGCLGALWRAPPIAGLTEPLIALSEARRNIVLTRLAGAKLVTVNRSAAGALLSLDAHPLLREYFANVLREERPEAWKAAHKRLYEHLTTTTPDKPAPTLEDLQPLYQAVAHGCLAGMQQEACVNVYRDRILRGTGAGGFYSTTKLGAFGADLGAVACFFDPPWSRLSPNLTPPDQAWLLSVAAFDLRALGRLAEAREPMRAGLDTYVGQENWENAAIAVSNLSQLELILGEVEPAIEDGEAAVDYGNRSGQLDRRLRSLGIAADAFRQSGDLSKAKAYFENSESIQALEDPERPLIYSVGGFLYSDFLLGEAETIVWRRIVSPAQVASQALLASSNAVAVRARRTLGWAQAADASLLALGLDHLTLARAALYAAILDGERPGGDHLREAADFLRRAAAQEFLHRALLTRALFRATTGAFDGARDDLDEAYEIAERGPMKLFLADIHLHRARLFGLMPSRPAAYPWVSPRDDLDAAKKLIAECGYGRRREELADAEAAYARIHGGAR
jgi:tetratricopeptide (TPR) repeat protein